MSVQRRREEGFALVTALWASLILALVASYILVGSRTGARISRTATIQAQQRAAAEGIINLVTLRLLGPNAGSLRLDGTPFEVAWAGYNGRVVLQEQAGLIDLNAAPAATLKRLLTVVGQLDPAAADTMADRILDWRERGAGRRLNGAKAEEYAAAGYPYAPRQGRFESVAELKLVLGMTAALYERMAPALTVHSQIAVLDPDTAPAITLSTMAGVDADRVADMLAEREKRHSGSAPANIGSGASDQALGISVAIQGQKSVSTNVQTTLRCVAALSGVVWVYEYQAVLF